MKDKLRTLFGRYYNPMFVQLAGILLVIVTVVHGAPDASGWP
jgi:hypothetical protein